MSKADKNNAQYRRNIAALPPYCYAVIADQLVRINVGEAGVYPMLDDAGRMVEGYPARKRAELLNRSILVTPAQQQAMVAGYREGWESPNAHPEAYS